MVIGFTTEALRNLLVLLAALIAAILAIVNGGGTGGTNSAPTATSAIVNTTKNVASSPVSPSVTDPDSGDTHTISIESQPANGVASVVSNQLVYTPNLNFSGADSFNIRATDSGGLYVVGTAAVTVTNTAPSAVVAIISTNKNTASAPVAPVVTDADPGDLHTIAIVTQPTRGFVTLSGNQLVYTPDSHVVGTDSFTISATDTDGASVVGVAGVTISSGNSAPAATQAGITARSGPVSSSPVTPYVRDADFPESFTYQLLSAPANGIASIIGGRLVYTPNPGFNVGTDSFDYRATDSAGQMINGTARVRVYDNTPPGSTTGLARCTMASTVNVDGTLAVRTNAGSCGFYGEITTRQTASGVPVTMKYMVHRPSSGVHAKAVVILIAGGNLNANLTGGDATTGVIGTTGGNFVVRSAQLLAEAGFVAVVIDRPSDRADVAAEVDAYRISVDHAVDMLAVADVVNPDNLPLVLAGTSRGAMSVVANNLIASGIHISSAVTGGAGLYVGVPGVANLQPTFVQRVARVIWHQNDLCPISTPAASLNLFSALNTNLTGLGLFATNGIAAGGVRVTAPSATVTPDICGAFDYHGFLGIEPSLIATEAGFLDLHVNWLGTNRVPRAAPATVRVAAGASKSIDLAPFAMDPDGDPMTFALSHATTSLGGTVTLTGSQVSYTPPIGASNQKDYFVYVVTDGKQGVRAEVATVEIGN